mgnify:CR=1 FL=1
MKIQSVAILGAGAVGCYVLWGLADKAAANSMLNDFNLRVMQEAETLTEDLTNQIFTVRTQDIQADIFFANKAKKD